MDHANSRELFARARRCIPGGVNSPVRAFPAVGGDPVFYAQASGSQVTDVDGNVYIDFVGSWGPMILGHRPRRVLDAVEDQLQRGTSYGAPCEAEVLLAEKVCELVPAIEKVRMVSSGTEATMSALRVARGYTGRDRFIKFRGNYHGHSDCLLAEAGSGVATCGIPGTPGVTAGEVADTLVADYNDLDSVRSLFEANPTGIAAVIVEPVAANMGVVAPQPGFLKGLRDLCDTFGALLIFDEVITGFRVALGGAQELYGVIPDLCCLGKIVGGGFPVGAFGGRADVMDVLAPEGPVYQAGTLSGNPIAMAAGLATLSQLVDEPPYDYLEDLGAQLEEGLRGAAYDAGIPMTVNRVGSLLTCFFTDGAVGTWDDVARCDTDRFSRFFRSMLDSSLLIAPSQFEAVFLAATHTSDDVDAFIAAADKALALIGND